MYIKLLSYLLKHKGIAYLLTLFIILLAYRYAPITLGEDLPYRDAIGVDAIPNLGENQQIVSVEWPGHNPQEIEDQITYPLSASLLGVKGVSSVRTVSMYGLSSVYVIFEDQMDFYESRSRLLEKIASLEPNLLPENLSASLGPDATGLGQVYWYTISSDSLNLHELRTLQDYYIKPSLSALSGVAEVSSIGGFEKEYLIQIDPQKLNQYKLNYDQIEKALKNNNLESSAQTIELNRIEYLIRSKGYIENLDEFRSIPIVNRDNTPVYLKDIAKVILAPKARRGLLDKSGREAVGGVVVARFGENPAEVIDLVKRRVGELELTYQVDIESFYDRSNLIQETLSTLWEALSLELLITILVILLILRSFKSSVLISAMLPMAVLLVFSGMHLLDIEANIVALSGIAIAIGTMVDMGIVMVENIARYRKEHPTVSVEESVLAASSEVSPAILTALLTTLVSFIPVFALQGVEGKLFSPLAWTKTLALISAYLISVLLIPVYASILFKKAKTVSRFKWSNFLFIPVLILLAYYWSPLGPGTLRIWNVLAVLIAVLPILGLISLLLKFYEPILRWVLGHKWMFIAFPLVLFVFSGLIFVKLPRAFMPTLNEGSFLLMPTTLPNSSIEENKKYLSALDQAVASIPEVISVVGKAGRVNSALDPAPLSMFEVVVLYMPEFDNNGERNWRDHIESSDDIWGEIVEKSNFPGLTSAPKLQPIQTRLLMLQTGMRAPLGMKIRAASLEELNKVSQEFEGILNQVDGVKSGTVYADKILGKPYLNVNPKRNALAQYGLNVSDLQKAVQIAISGKLISTSYEGRERFGIRMRYPIEYRDNLAAILKEVYVINSVTNQSIPLEEVAEVNYEPGPQMIKGEDGFLVNYLVFDSDTTLDNDQLIENIALELDRQSAHKDYEFSGDYVNQQRAQRALQVLLPLVLLIILAILMIQFKSLGTSLMIFTSIFTAICGGFLALYFYDGIALTVAVWVGFIALFGIATDDGVLMATYLDGVFKNEKANSREEVQDLVVKAGLKRIRPCLMTTATTLIALLPVLTATGKGSEIMIPMAIPTFGGMLVSLISLFLLPMLYSWRAENNLKKN
ncbi:MAG: efflux RND transporter permease subunit [Flavobacteriaceae bacterium]